MSRLLVKAILYLSLQRFRVCGVSGVFYQKERKNKIAVHSACSSEAIGGVPGIFCDSGGSVEFAKRDAHVRSAETVGIAERHFYFTVSCGCAECSQDRTLDRSQKGL